MILMSSVHPIQWFDCEHCTVNMFKAVDEIGKGSKILAHEEHISHTQLISLDSWKIRVDFNLCFRS